MPDVKISALPAATSFLDADEFPVNEAGTSKKVTGTVLKAWAGNVIRNFSTTAQTPAAGASTYITGSALTIPVGKLRIGTILRWSFNMTKTAAGSAAGSLQVLVGTTGTVGDTSRLTFAKPAGTADADEAFCTITVVCRGPLSASGIFTGEFVMVHNLAATGHAVIPCVVVNAISAAFDVTVASLIVGLVITTGAADAITIQQVTSEAINL